MLEHAPAVIGAAAEGMFAQYNWHLFWFAVALTLVVRFAELQAIARRCVRSALFLAARLRRSCSRCSC